VCQTPIKGLVFSTSARQHVPGPIKSSFQMSSTGIHNWTQRSLRFTQVSRDSPEPKGVPDNDRGTCGKPDSSDDDTRHPKTKTYRKFMCSVLRKTQPLSPHPFALRLVCLLPSVKRFLKICVHQRHFKHDRRRSRRFQQLRHASIGRGGWRVWRAREESSSFHQTYGSQSPAGRAAACRFKI
jgi:hypothetical protein